MKNKMFTKWMHRLPVLLLALILAVMPFTMAVPADASVLSGSSVPSYDGYFYLGSLLVEGVYAHYYVSDNVSSPNASYFLIDGGDSFVLGRGSDLRYKQSSIFGYANIYDLTLNSDILDQSVSSNLGYYAFCFDAVFNSNVIVSYPVPPDASVIAFGGIAGSDVFDYFLEFAESAFNSIHVLDVFSGAGAWLSGAVQNISTMFWTAESGMSVLGYLAVASLALAVILLIFYLIAGLLKFH